MELRIGHEQVTFYLTEVKLENGGFSIEGTADSIDPRKLSKLSGEQPHVLIGDDGSICGVWKEDLTYSFMVARKTDSSRLTYSKHFGILAIQEHA